MQSRAPGIFPKGERVSPLTTLGLGLVLGLKHAFDSDHLIAVSSIVARERSPWRSLWIGLFWGLGHTLTLLVIGALVLALDLRISPPVELSFECAVGVVLIVLGLSTLYDCRRRRVHVHPHEHGNAAHVHFHAHADSAAHGHAHPLRLGAKPFLVGMVHGLAGSAALILLVLTAVPSAALGLMYLAIFGCGAILGMGAVSLLMGVVFSFATNRIHETSRVLRLTVGSVSAAFGAWIVIDIGFVRGLFLG
jgi:sulfite exporter TauE/SafE